MKIICCVFCVILLSLTACDNKTDSEYISTEHSTAIVSEVMTDLLIIDDVSKEDISGVSNINENFEIVTESNIAKNKTDENLADIESVEMIIQLIEDSSVDNAGLYDFNHDGQPELVRMSMGEYFGENYYDVYEITEQQLKYLGCINASEFNYCNEFALYKNNETNKFFYLADCMRVEGANNIVKTNIITFENGKMLINELANYTYIWDPELYEQGMINVSESGFMDKINPITGIQNITEINGLLGITDYLKSYEKIETMHFEALWGYDFNETAKEVLKQELLKGYSEK